MFVFFAQEKLCNLWPCDVFTKLEKLKKKKKSSLQAKTQDWGCDLISDTLTFRTTKLEAQRNKL